MDKLLSLCMIVKNEEKVLRRCLTSIRDCVDEIIIIDTGSTDGTKEIAREYTEQLYEYKWEQDFSAARNEALRKSRSKWILVLDADEYVQTEELAQMRNFLLSMDSTKPVSFLLPIYNFTESVQSGKFVESTAIRIFLNHPDIYFVRPIHEQLVYQNGELQTTFYPSLHIFHTGYTEETLREKDKSNRNLAIFEKLKETKEFEEYDYYTLGNEYFAIRDFPKALENYKKAMTSRSKNQVYMLHCFNRTVSVLMTLELFDDAMSLVEEGIQRWPDQVDYFCFKAAIYKDVGLYEKAAEFFELCIQMAENPKDSNGRYWVVSPNYGNFIPYSNLASIYHSLLDIPKTVYVLTKLINLDSSNQAVLFQLLKLLLPNEPMSSIITLLDKIYFEMSQKQVLQLFEIALLLSHKGLAEHFYQLCLRENIPLSPLSQMRYALISDDLQTFDICLSNIHLDNSSDQQGQINKLTTIAEAIWDKSYHSEDLLDIELSVSILIDLFNMGHYSAYDSLIQNASHDKYVIANRLGDYFIGNGQYQLAIDYYSLLLLDDKLESSGYENLARLYLMQDEIKESLQFLRKAIELETNSLGTYTLMLRYCDEDEKKEVLRVFKERFPECYSVVKNY
ncbi:glycosyltransferase [Paenibacillus alba]|uniref:glycosyltransferase n=1 Tax=Paenibacillus alba TaxID=1197127 RepID=UPI0015665C3E|nr:glycosyltransferase [Paenibacillus alba]NQX70104.1 glycosyltransferase [Paenibacillus alba]